MNMFRILIFGSFVVMLSMNKVWAEDCDLTYYETTNGYVVTGATNKSTCTKADIPSTYNNKPVISISQQAFYFSSIEEVSIPDSVISIGGGAFGYTQLSTVVIPTSVTSIGSNAFYYYASSKEKRIYCPEGLNCQAHGSIDPISYSKVGNDYVRNGQSYSTFEDMEKSLCPEGHQCWRCGSTREACTGDFDPETGKLVVTGNGTMTMKPWDSVRASITSADINGVTNIMGQAFYFSQIKEVNIGDSVTSIGDGAFGYTQLSTVVVPDSVTSVGSNAFYYYASPKEKKIYCPEGLDCHSHGVVANLPYGKVGDYYSLNGKMYRDAEHMLKGIEMKRIYTVSEAENALGKQNKNTFSIRYR